MDCPVENGALESVLPFLEGNRISFKIQAKILTLN